MTTQLPPEILYQIINSPLPTPTPPTNTTPIALAASNPITKTLLSWTRTCRATHGHASKHLYTYSVYIDRLDKLHQLVRTLASPNGSHHACHIHSLYLSIKEISMDQILPSNIIAVTKLLRILSPTLTRFLMDMPSALSQSQEDARDIIRPELSQIDSEYIQAFESLVHLTLFVNLHDNFQFLGATGSPIWHSFPRLRILGMRQLPNLYGSDTWKDVMNLTRVETFIMLDDTVEFSSLKGVWRAERPLNVVLVNDGEEVTCESYWGTTGKKISIRKVRFRRESDNLDGFVKRKTEWLRCHLLRGEDCFESLVEELQVPVLKRGNSASRSYSDSSASYRQTYNQR